VTFLCVVLAFVVFRADSWSSAIWMMEALLYPSSWHPGESYLSATLALVSSDVLAVPFELGEPVLVITALVAIALLIALLAPSAVDMVNDDATAFDSPTTSDAFPVGRFKVRPTLGWTMLLALLGWCCLNSITRLSPFLYFQF
jgi:hypothetical protein